MMSFSSKRGIKCYDSTNKRPTRLYSHKEARREVRATEV